MTLDSFLPTVTNLPPCITSFEAEPMHLSEISFLPKVSVPPCITRLPSNLKKLSVFTVTCPSPSRMKSPLPSIPPFMVTTVPLLAILSTVLS